MPKYARGGPLSASILSEIGTLACAAEMFTSAVIT